MEVSRRHVAVTLAVTVALLVGGVVLNEIHMAQDSVVRGTASEVGSWADPGGQGGALRLSYSGDLSRLLAVTPGSTAGVRVLDRGMVPLWDMPTDATGGGAVRGASWAPSQRYILVWHGGADHDSILTFNATTYAPEDLPTGGDAYGLDPLRTVDSALLLADDEILVVAGRDANGTSRLRMHELVSGRLHRDHELAGNGTVMEMVVQGNELWLADDAGTLHLYETFDWLPLTTFQVLEGAATCWDLHTRPVHPAAGAKGRIGLVDVSNAEVLGPYRARGPVQAVAMGRFIGRGFMLASVARSGGGSDVEIWDIGLSDENPTDRVGSFRANATVTSMVSDPVDPSEVLLLGSDGSIHEWRVEFSDHEAERTKTWRRWSQALFDAGFICAAVTVVLLLRHWRGRPAPAGDGGPGTGDEDGRRLKVRRAHLRRR